jgi:hypothetical protein
VALLLDAAPRTLPSRGKPRAGVAYRSDRSPSRAAVDEGNRTLDDVLSGAWEGLSAAAPVTCPVCAGELTPRWSAGAGVVGGRCGDCGTELR